jgi:hypothetical protein
MIPILLIIAIYTAILYMAITHRNNIYCNLGMHSWLTVTIGSGETGVDLRRCRICGKIQRKSHISNTWFDIGDTL